MIQSSVGILLLLINSMNGKELLLGNQKTIQFKSLDERNSLSGKMHKSATNLNQAR